MRRRRDVSIVVVVVVFDIVVGGLRKRRYVVVVVVVVIDIAVLKLQIRCCSSTAASTPGSGFPQPLVSFLSRCLDDHCLFLKEGVKQIVFSRT